MQTEGKQRKGQERGAQQLSEKNMKTKQKNWPWIRENVINVDSTVFLFFFFFPFCFFILFPHDTSLPEKESLLSRSGSVARREGGRSYASALTSATVLLVSAQRTARSAHGHKCSSEPFFYNLCIYLTLMTNCLPSLPCKKKKNMYKYSNCCFFLPFHVDDNASSITRLGLGLLYLYCLVFF